MDSDEDQYIISDVDSDAFVPEPPKKAVPAASKAKAPAKAKASTTASKKSAPKQPLAPRRSNGGESEEEGDISVRFEEEEDASPKKKTPVKAKGGKSASQTYQKVSRGAAP